MFSSKHRKNKIKLISDIFIRNLSVDACLIKKHLKNEFPKAQLSMNATTELFDDLEPEK